MIGLHFNVFYQYARPVSFRCIQQQNNIVDLAWCINICVTEWSQWLSNTNALFFYLNKKAHLADPRLLWPRPCGKTKASLSTVAVLIRCHKVACTFFQNGVMSPYRSMSVLCGCINSTTADGKLNAYGKSQINLLQSVQSSEGFLQAYWKYKGTIFNF